MCSSVTHVHHHLELFYNLCLFALPTTEFVGSHDNSVKEIFKAAQMIHFREQNKKQFH